MEEGNLMKYTDLTETKQILTRLKTVRGHVAAVERMIEEEKTCEEVLLQLVAIRSAEAIDKGEDRQQILNKAIDTLMKLNQ